MIKTVLKRFQELFNERCNRIPLVKLGEDSVRYDFFSALIEVVKLKPCDIQIEVSIKDESDRTKFFIPRNNENSKRKENPLMDLVIDKGELIFCAEFGLFKQNSNEKGSINKTARTVKMINDMIRLGIYSHYTKKKAYFICVADAKMLNHQLRSKIIGSFPSNYHISMDLVRKQMENKTAAFDKRFIEKFEEMKCSFQAKIIFNEEIKAKKINRETRIIVWEIIKI